MDNYYLWFKSIHIISVIAWMAGMFYLPRLYVYHCRAKVGSEMDKTFQIMEQKLLRIIMNPAMILTYIFGFLNAHIYGFVALGLWFYIKMFAVLCMTIFHAMLSIWRKDFLLGQNKHSERFYRIVNEIPTILLIISVFMVVIKPFD